MANESKIHIAFTRTRLVVMSLICLAFCSVIVSPTQGQTHKIPAGSIHHTVQLDGAGEPLIILANALKQKPHASRFQVQWFQMVLSQDYDSAALYDRNKHTLIFDCHGHWDGGRMHERTFYTKVTDEVISKAAKTNQGNINMQVDSLAGGFRAYFDTLAFYGATVQSKHEESQP